jgi:NAD(P)-dependent dehydrogenase (short-subunit alcohol dehydrogenase family)
MEIKNNLAVITGGGSGLGAATACHLAQLGAKVAVLDTNINVAQLIANEVNGKAYQCNISDEKNVTEIMTQIQNQMGDIRICINCAGIAPAKRIVGKEGAMPLEEFNKVIQVNLVGTFNVMRLAANNMSKLQIINDSGERGIIINTASVAAYEGQIGQAAYSASKGGVVSLTLPAARELSRFGIRVMTIAPGLMATPMLLNMPADVQESLANSIPFPKRFGKPEEYAKLVEHIIHNTMLNGSVIRLDGALRMQEK